MTIGAGTVTRVRAGDTEAFAEVYHAHVDALWRFATQLLGSPDTAKDVVQDVFLALWHTRTTWDPGDSIRAYLFRAVRNRVISQWRHDRVEQQLQQFGEPSDDDEIPGMGVAPPSPETAVLTADAQAMLQRVVATLPERQRTALTLWWRDELSLTEIATVLGVSIPAAHKLLAKAQTKVLGIARG